MLTAQAIDTTSVGQPLPAGYSAVSLGGQAITSWPLSVCLVISTAPSGDPLVIVREALDARVYLGCVTDAAGRVQQWLDIWVQDVDGLADAIPTYREALTNAKLDARWSQGCSVLEALAQERGCAVIRTGYEDQHPEPMLLDLTTSSITRPIEGGSNGAWVLCTDDGLLARKGLPAYSASLHRYLYVRELGDESFFIPATRGAPAGERMISAHEALGLPEPGSPGATMVPVNFSGGLMFIAEHQSYSFEQYIDALGGLDSKDTTSSSRSISENGIPAASLLTLGRGGKAGRLVEAFHLKLRALADAVDAVRTLTARTQTPLLNLTAASFAVQTRSGTWGLPSLWSSRTVLLDPGEAVSLKVPGSDVTYFVTSGVKGPTVYSPGIGGRSSGGQGSLQIRQVKLDNGTTIVEGTLRSHERMSVGVSDLVWLRFSLGTVRFDLYGSGEVRSGARGGEMLIRTVPQRIDEKDAAKIKAAEGVSVQGVMFETLAVASTPCDLFALAVLAARTLLVSAKNPLPVALDELQSLAGEVGAAHDANVGMGLRVRGIVEPGGKGGSSRWIETLGPQHLIRDALEPAEALAAVTPEVWFDTLAMLVRALPGAGADSACRDFGDALPGAVHRAFDRMSDDLRDLLTRTRSLVVNDVHSSREIRSAVARFATGGKVARR